jgi:hypothetical protein
LSGEDWIQLFYRSISRQFQSPGKKSHTAARLGTADHEYDLDLYFQSNKLTSGETCNPATIRLPQKLQRLG